MTSVKQTTLYQPTPVAPFHNNLFGTGPQPGTIATGAALTGANLLTLDGSLGAHPESEMLFFSAGEPAEKSYWFVRKPTFSLGYYVFPKRLSLGANNTTGVIQLLESEAADIAPPQLVSYAVCVGGALRFSEEVITLESQRQERKATANLAQRVQTLLPGFSEQDVGRLVGVSRIAWRGWIGGSTAARRSSRQRLLRLERILALRSRVDPDTSLTHWLDSPVGAGLDATPARLLADGRDQLVAILAARLPAPRLDSYARLDAPSEYMELLNTLRVDERFSARREIYSHEDDDAD